MINLIFQTVIDTAQEKLGTHVMFKRVEENSEQFAPAFLVVINGEPTNHMFNSAILNNDEVPTSKIAPQIINGLLHLVSTLKVDKQLDFSI